MLALIKSKITNYWNVEYSGNQFLIFRYLIGVVGFIHILDNILNADTYLNLVVNLDPAIPWKQISPILPEFLYQHSVYLTIQLALATLFLLLAAGLLNKPARIILALLYFLNYNLQLYGGYGAEQYILLALFYVPFMPLEKTDRDIQSKSIATQLFKFHFTLTLLEVSSLKLMQPGWWSGESLYSALTGPWSTTSFFLSNSFENYSWLFCVMAWGSMLLQFSEAILLNTRFQQQAAIVLMLFHLSLVITMGMPYFAIVIIGTLTLFLVKD